MEASGGRHRRVFATALWGLEQGLGQARATDR